MLCLFSDIYWRNKKMDTIKLTIDNREVEVPKGTTILKAAAQMGIFAVLLGSLLLGFTPQEAGSLGIIGGADGPTAIFVTAMLAPALLGPIAVSAYSYMALVPVIQPPIMKALTTEKERQIVMKPLREVSKREKIIFPIVVTIFVALLVPSAAPLIACLMLGNLFKECGVVERLNKTAQNELMNIVTIFLGITVGATATASTFLSFQTIKIIIMGVVAFGCGTAGGVLLVLLPAIEELAFRYCLFRLPIKVGRALRARRSWSLFPIPIGRQRTRMRFS